MRAFLTLILCATLASVYFYNTNWFQSTFLYNRFYQPIYDAPFDATKRGEKVSIPLKYTYQTCYDLALTVPDKNVFHHSMVGPGRLAYRFVSGGKLLGNGLSFPPDRHQLGLRRNTSLIPVMLFDLPFPGQSSELVLELEVVEPFEFLAPYKDNIKCRITPDYDPKVNRCIGEALRINQ
ncbi:hypothetical protein GM415_05195 [Pseudodesulfovibrio cashew]|uniref:Uncharacterized protein n=1 Tax=Pseudodesulfovibrio cashew TaxID=2678688 RepID=A0A6I6JHH3_9BACT|nr:hypothetical protein [Pseudodesulfovibrio cashew]QGY39537.1 hypothetical protein GM415_05195 [Pseudodesulfovibrio cashew]